MNSRVVRVGVALLKAAHFGPTVLVVSITFLLARTHFSTFESARISLAIFAGQLIVGWTNDLVDYPLDLAANRISKPLVSNLITSQLLRNAIRIDLLAAMLLSYFSPLGFRGTIIHLLGVVSATSYNLRFKSTILSPLPYAFSFGLLPWAIYESAHATPPLWVYADFVLVSVAFHFLNVIKDLTWDINQGVLGLPQRIGKWWSVTTAIALISLAALTPIIFK